MNSQRSFDPLVVLVDYQFVCANEEDLRSEHEAEYELDPINVTEATTDLAPEVDQLQAKQEEGVDLRRLLGRRERVQRSNALREKADRVA